MSDELVTSYRLLVGALLDHSDLHEGTRDAVSHFLGSSDPSIPILNRIIEAEAEERSLGWVSR